MLKIVAIIKGLFGADMAGNYLLVAIAVVTIQ